jgi:hypothetical protein
VDKSLLKPLTVAEMRDQGGSKITKIGVRRRKKVALLLANAHQKGRSTLGGVTKKLKREMGRERNWERVARTELTNAKGNASLGVIQQVFGSDAKVFRLPSPSCCGKCRKLFGKHRIYQADKIPPEIVGAVHPNCDCGPWQCVDKPDLTKAVGVPLDVPMGLVKRQYDPHIQHDVAVVSTGTGYWVRLDSPTGRSITQTIAMCVPAVKLRERDGFTVFVHGAARVKEGKVDLYDLRKLQGARFYPMDLGHDQDLETRQKSVTQIRHLNDYLTHLKTVMPHVALMPEYWESDRQTRWLTDFFGYKTLTDWIVVVPGAVENKIKTITLSVLGHKKAIRSVAYKLLEGSRLEKCRSY